jgi:hypothetical protein
MQEGKTDSSGMYSLRSLFCDKSIAPSKASSQQIAS